MALTGEMAKFYMSNSNYTWVTPPTLSTHPQFSPRSSKEQKQSTVTSFAANAGGFPLNSVFKRCQTCGGKGAVECAGCKGTGKNKKNGNIFERWKCFDCQGFGLKSCPNCGQGGLTPEQRGER